MPVAIENPQPNFDDMDDLDPSYNPATFYHASPRRFETGTAITPGTDRNQQNFPVGGNQQVYLSGSQDDSEDWAGHIGRTLDAPAMHVYEVRPLGEPRRHKGDFGWEFTVERAEIVEHLLTLLPEDWDESDWW